MRLAVLAGLLFSVASMSAQGLPSGYALYGEMCWDTYVEVLGPFATSLDLAQVEQESGWRPNVCSPYACGLTQFTPATKAEMERRIGTSGTIMDPEHACLLQAHYNKAIARRINGRVKGWLAEHHWKYRVYNGGEGWLLREWRACGQPDNTVQIEPCRARARWAHKENTEYPWRITNRWKKYLAHGLPR